MLSTENKNLLITYLVTLIVTTVLIVVIVNFNGWFFPNDQLKLSEFTPASRGVLSERDLHFNLFSDEKFTKLQPILKAQDLEDAPVAQPNAPTGTVKPSTRPPVELRHSNPFLPF